MESEGLKISGQPRCTITDRCSIRVQWFIGYPIADIGQCRERSLLQINIATLVSLATLLLSMGEDNPGKPLLVGMAAAASIWLTDVRRAGSA